MFKATARTVTKSKAHITNNSNTNRNPFARLQVDIETVLLNETNRPIDEVYDEARQRFETPGCCLIVKFDLQGEALDDDPMLKLGMTMYLRSVLERCVIATDHDSAPHRAKLIKYDDARAFLFHENANIALRSACQAHLVAKYCHEMFWAEQQVSITVTCGLEVGNLLLLVGDYYGDAVNVASKLGEDHAEAGQILISHPCHDAIGTLDPELLNLLTVQDGLVHISGVEIPYKSITMGSPAVEEYFLAQSGMPSRDDVLSMNEASNAARRVCLRLLMEQDATELDQARAALQEQRQTVTMLQSDMSGFTRLTKKYGILHFLTLVTHCRKIFKECLPPHDGSIVKYDGDNVIAKFASPTQCLAAVRAIHAGIDAYNVGKEQDYQIRIKLGVSHGPVVIVGHDIVGESWEDCCALGEDTAEVGEVLVTTAVYEYLQNCPDQPQEQQGNNNSHFGFESRQVELDHGEMLHHYNVTFPKENNNDPPSSCCSKVSTPSVFSSKEAAIKSPHSNTKQSLQPAILPMVLDEMRFI